MDMRANTPPDFTLKTDRDDLDLPAEQVVVAYHERTKHHYHRYAASLGYLDWAKQPDPFRRYDGAPLVRLPFPDAGRALPYWQLYVADNMVPAPLSVDSISLFLRYAFSLTAWKRFEGTTWSLRANPSSGNLHPTEGYVLLPSLDAIHNRPGVYHYASKAHGLELRADFDPSVWAALTAAFPEGSFLVGLSSILWREAWKYGERAFRYCQHDVGHALGSMRFAAAALGWKFRLLDRVGNAAVSQLLGLDREADYTGAEREHPELVALVVREKWASDRGLCLSKELVSQVATSRWYGTANVLSPEHGVDWPVIDQVAAATTNSEGLRPTKSSPGSLRRKSSSGRQFGPEPSLRKKSSWGAEARSAWTGPQRFLRRPSSGCWLVSYPPETADLCRGTPCPGAHASTWASSCTA